AAAVADRGRGVSGRTRLDAHHGGPRRRTGGRVARRGPTPLPHAGGPRGGHRRIPRRRADRRGALPCGDAAPRPPQGVGGGADVVEPLHRTEVPRRFTSVGRRVHGRGPAFGAGSVGGPCRPGVAPGRGGTVGRGRVPTRRAGDRTGHARSGTRARTGQSAQ